MSYTKIIGTPEGDTILLEEYEKHIKELNDILVERDHEIESLKNKLLTVESYLDKSIPLL